MVRATACCSLLITVCLLLGLTAFGNAQSGKRRQQEPRGVTVVPVMPTATPGAQRTALVIGNTAYLHSSPLRNPVNDAMARWCWGSSSSHQHRYGVLLLSRCYDGTVTRIHHAHRTCTCEVSMTDAYVALWSCHDAITRTPPCDRSHRTSSVVWVASRSASASSSFSM
jgi:hypothetical protein